jgi:hypothetical protein
MERLIQYIGNHPVLSGAAIVVAIAAIVIELRARATSFMAIGPQDAVRLMNQNWTCVRPRPLPPATSPGHATCRSRRSGRQLKH